MQIAVTNFVKNHENGLCLIDMPTGTGKTYQTREIIKKFVKEEILTDIKLIIYLTPLNKNIDDFYNDLKKDFEDDLEVFNNRVLRIYSNYECVLKYFLDVEKQIPTSIRKKNSFKQLKNKILIYKKLGENKNLSGEILRTTLKEIRTSYEPQFRRDVEIELHKVARTKSEKRKMINHDKYSWIKKLYPSCLSEERKVLFMTMDKFLFGNDPIISKPYKFLSHAKTKGALIFIDEFDATKDAVLNQEVEKCTGYKIDLAKLFSGIVTSLKGTKVPESIFAESEDSKKSFEKMKKIMLDIEEEYNLDYIFKLESTLRNDRYFLFDDYQIHTITLGNNESHVSVKIDKKKNQNMISIGKKKDDGYFYRAIYGMKGALNYFIRCCSILSRNYLNRRNEIAKINHEDQMEIEQAVSTIMDFFNLDSEIARTISSLIVDDIALPMKSRKRDIISTDFYMNGFRYYDFKDDISHDVSTSIEMCYLNNTPEKFIISLANKARVVGLSATATLESVTGNYNLNYIQEKLKDKYFKLSIEDENRIKEYVNKQLECKYPINVSLIGMDGEDSESISKTLFKKDNNIETSISMFNNYSVSEKENSRNYNNVRLGKVLLAINRFLVNKDSNVLLVLTNRNPKSTENISFSKQEIDKFIKKFVDENCLESAPKTFYLFGEDFEEQKAAYQNEIGNENKIILFSSYPSVGTGQNLQYELNIDDEIKKQKDIDSIYIELPTNVIIHYANLNEEGNLNKYIFQMETLRANGEISPIIAMENIKSAFKKYINPNANANFDRSQYQCVSPNNHKVKILVQAVGRICRTKDKGSEHKVNIYVDNEIMKNVDFRCMKKRLMNPEFAKIVEMSKRVLENDLETKTNLNKAMDCNLRVEKRIENILSSNKLHWDIDDMRQWDLIRQIVLKHPTISRQKLKELSSKEGLESIKDFYLYANEGNKLCSYIYNKETSKIKFVDNANKEEGDITINADSSRLYDLLSSPNVKQTFISKGYATSFIPDECMILPVVFQNIYKGAIGEVAGKAILEAHGIKLLEIEDPSKFEKFDFCCEENNNVYIDFKNWSEDNRVSRDEYKLHSNEKLEKINGIKGYIINLLASEFNEHDSDNIVEISSLFKYENGKWCESSTNIDKLVKKILEVCMNGD